MLRGSKSSRILVGGLLLSSLVAGLVYAQRSGRVAPEALLPERALLFAKADGEALHLSAYQRTAAYEAFEKSGLVDVFERAMEQFQSASGQGREFGEIFNHLKEHGLSLAVTVEPPDQGAPRPWGVIVVHEAGGNEDYVGRLLEMVSQGEFESRTEVRRGREVTWGMLEGSPVELGWWTEKNHLVIAVGLGAIESALAVADGTSPNVTRNPLWTKYTTPVKGFEQTMTGWFHFKPLVDMFGGIPVPSQGQKDEATVQDILESIGLANLEVIASRTGYRGRSIWSEVDIVAPGESTGLLALARQTPFTLNDLPKLPAENDGIVASSFDWGKAWGVVEQIVDAATNYAEPEVREQFEEGLQESQRELGVDLKRDLFDALGSIHVVYNDSRQGMFGMGFALVIKTKNAMLLDKTLKTLLSRAEGELRGKMAVKAHSKHGRKVYTIVPTEVPVFTPAYCIDNNWLVIGLLPQTVEAFLMRQDGNLPAWSPDEETKAALAEMPAEFTSITIVDPRPTYSLVMSLAPMFAGFIETGMREAGQVPPDFVFPISGADLPPAEVVTGPLHVNVAMTVVENGTTRVISRQSSPGIPFLGGGSDAATSAATIGVLTALLLPAVQQAREAARRTKSKNNMKMLGLAMHNYHDVYRHFPQGVIPGSGDTPEESLSWMVSVLPFVDQAPLYDRFNQQAGWQAFANREGTRIVVPEFVNPAISTTKVEGTAVTHYVGLGGLGEDGPTLPARDPRAGVFAYNRTTGIRDITDGTANTAMIAEATEFSVGPWAAGGQSTIRSLTEQPYINGVDGIGSPFRGGCHVLMADGSVHFISEYIDPEVFEGMNTINGGEAVDF